MVALARRASTGLASQNKKRDKQEQEKRNAVRARARKERQGAREQVRDQARGLPLSFSPNFSSCLQKRARRVS